jgi:hypothetical protein
LTKWATIHTSTALNFLIHLFLHEKDNTSDLLEAITQILNHLSDKKKKSFQHREIDQTQLLILCEDLIKKDDKRAQQVALWLIGAFKVSSGLPLLFMALNSESVFLRIYAIEAAGNFSDEEVIHHIAYSVTHKPEDYEIRKLSEFITYSPRLIEFSNALPDYSVFRERFDLDFTAIRILEQIGTPSALLYAEQFKRSASVATDQIKHTEKDKTITISDLISLAKSVSEEVAIFHLPEGIRTWIHSSYLKDTDDFVRAIVVKNDGTRIIGSGRRNAVLQELIYPYSLGKVPKESEEDSVKQGEFMFFEVPKKREEISDNVDKA